MSEALKDITVRSLTNVETDKLKARKLVNQKVAVGNQILNPGGTVVVKDTPAARHRLKSLTDVGVVEVVKLKPKKPAPPVVPPASPSASPATSDTEPSGESKSSSGGGGGRGKHNK